MANGPPYVVEFLFRGRDPTDETGLPATYHVILGRWVDTIDNGRKLETGRTLRPAQATAAGFPLTALTGAIAAQAMIDKDQADAAAFAATTARNAAEVSRSAMLAERDAALQAKATAEAALATSQAALATSQASLAASEAALLATQAQLAACVQQGLALAAQLAQAAPAAESAAAPVPVEADT